ncbi:MAG TPA: hypothetical protein VG452_11490 [Egibacteraceae bacterium]|nr:MBL fold metallo-hydrolase [Actinomycetota bacterium]HWB72831.1 hypothetical protein [Egibacteraceae bacterium]
MEPWICVTCGVQHPQARQPPRACAICEDERQYVPVEGQGWTTLPQMRADGYRIELRGLEPGLTGVGVVPVFGIGQRALLVRTAGGNLLWDCVGYLDDDAVEAVRALGGLDAIAVSHPHFYGAMVEWSRAFGSAPIWLPTADRAWVLRPDRAIRWWEHEAEPLRGLRLIQCGGHFDGSAVLHWPEGSGGRGALLVGDTAHVVADRRHVSFMRSYPNHIPLPAQEVIRVADAALRLTFDRVYGAWWDRVIAEDGQRALRRSADRYVAAVRA